MNFIATPVPGFSKFHSAECEDVDECESHPCDINADCQNTIGAFVCHCTEGFVGDGLYCDLKAVDECVEGTHKEKFK